MQQGAVDLHTRALAIARRSDDLNVIAITLLDLGEAHIATGDPHTALPLLREALDLTTRAKDRHHTERVHAALSHAEDVLRRAAD
ncbi:tetratricopeptide repeat protein [Saccharothrix carnea]|uniref:Tetratricopeptide repeat protein n=1 Tax=Saccharothrix carnea TaxID=1280637 RepID=A0A2P8IB89_SACCR|nr:tetratricopeptide repeat protein [Saccharothrix carnea]PSL55739.1 tetratricopeptide repeat protein [Saccharothrix carnea]